MTGLRVGVDVGGTKCLGVALAGGEVVAEHHVPTPATGHDLVAAIGDVAAHVAERAGGRAEMVGVGLPGLVDRDGCLRFAPNLPGVVEQPVGVPLAERLGLEVRCDNDATCAAWGEQQLGAAQGHRDVLMVTLGTGIGGGIIVGGHLQSGAHGYAGEIGHMVVDLNGPPCPCGRHGCWERFASGSGLGRIARDLATAGAIPAVVARAGGEPEAVRGEHVTEAGLEGDPGAVAVLAEVGRWLAVGLANLVAALDPAVIVIGGGLVDAGDLVLGPARTHLGELAVGTGHRPEVAVVPAALGARAGAVGAALLPGR